MISSQHWQELNDRAPTIVDRQGFEELEEIVLNGLFWARMREFLQYTKPIYNMIHFTNTDAPMIGKVYDAPVIGEVYEQMDNMLGQIKDIVQEQDPNLKPAPGGGVKAKPHIVLEVQNGYMIALDNLVPDGEECARLRLELGRCFTSTGVFGSLHAMEDRERFDVVTWWDTYGIQGPLEKMAKKVLSQVVNTSSTERCWSTYSLIHNVRRNRLNGSGAESLVYVHYNLRLLSHYYE
eukprot:PITA_10553